MELLKKALKHNDLILALGVVFALLLLLLPVPAFLIDIMLGFSIASSVVILMSTLLIAKPLELSIFPTVLLVTTVARLSLNVASTKLILANGHLGEEAAGKVIGSFGQFMMQGSVVIGITVFLILTIINFVVITKGSSRIAEVAARFSLDAMPGKQMAIDAELSVGSIDEETAKVRRAALEAETAFYGAMDGANKFVRGDAVASLIITFINLIGGVLVATLDKGLQLNKAIETYSILTVGDGLACQIPSVIISLAAGLLITKSSTPNEANRAIFEQLGNKPKPLAISSVLSALVAILPGLPFLPFALMSAILGGLAYRVTLNKEKQTSPPPKALAAEEPITEYLKVEPIKIELGDGLLYLARSSEALQGRIKDLRNQFASNLGLILPTVKLRDDAKLKANEYAISIKDVRKASGTLYPGRILVIKEEDEEFPFEGIDVLEPTFGLPATWVIEAYKPLLSKYSTLDCAMLLSTHLAQVVMNNVAQLLSYTETQKLVDEAARSHKKLIQDSIPEPLSISVIKKVLQRLLSENVSIRDLPTIIEACAEAARQSKEVVFIAESARRALSEQICFKMLDSDGSIPVAVVSQGWEQELSKAIVGSGERTRIVLSPEKLNEFLLTTAKVLRQNAKEGRLPCVLTSSSLRPYVRDLLGSSQKVITVLGHAEISDSYQIKSLGFI